jgi:hypothetical protein
MAGIDQIAVKAINKATIAIKIAAQTIRIAGIANIVVQAINIARIAI